MNSMPFRDGTEPYPRFFFEPDPPVLHAQGPQDANYYHLRTTFNMHQFAIVPHDREPCQHEAQYGVAWCRVMHRLG